jgi:hypothetical protein
VQMKSISTFLLHDDDEIWSLNLSEAIPGRTLSIVATTKTYHNMMPDSDSNGVAKGDEAYSPLALSAPSLVSRSRFFSISAWRPH